MTNENTLDRVRKIVAEIKELKDVKGDQRLVGNNFFDSADIVTLILSLEETFDIEIDADDISPENLETPASIARLVEDTANAAC
ncbi:MAG: acyl carrier protein [Alphaproteobacteria bacterium]|uniref:acyl carrier protein n=1 Tax=Roseibium sp. TaxID=1936156 RepID=UPI0032933F12